MHYNSNNADYYHSYKEEMKSITEYENEFSFQKILKIGFVILIIGLLSILSIYLVNYFSTARKNILLTENIKQVQEKEIKSISTNIERVENFKQNKSIEKTRKVSSKDVAVIVKIILEQMNHKKEMQLEKQLLSAQESKKNIKTLKETNHYNKAIVSSLKNTDNIDKQIQLRKDLNFIVASIEKNFSTYEEAIKKEIDIRTNEMRIIIVKKGDTLSKIARKVYGDIDAYPKIFMANPEVLKNPNEIFVGQRLRIPA